MPLIDFRPTVSAVKTTGKKQTSGKLVVIYRDLFGRTRSADVISSGTSSGLKLRVRMTGLTKIIDNVQLATAPKQTGVYFNRTA